MRRRFCVTARTRNCPYVVGRFAVSLDLGDADFQVEWHAGDFHVALPSREPLVHLCR